MKAIPALGRFAVVFAMVALGLLTAMGSLQSASARNSRDANRDELAQSRRAGPPMLAIVSLSDQRVTIYDAEGKILQSPVSTGSTGYETPAGIYSVVQKKAVHQSNVYEDGNMPFMQRITWTGIALHAGVLPGHPASHGCVRMPLAFAERLFGLTDIGLRVIVVRDDIAPADIAHPALFKPDPARREASLSPSASRPSGSEQRSAARVGLPASETDAAPGSARHLQILKSIADARTAEAEAAGKRAGAAKQAAARKAAEATPATKLLRAAESNYARAEELLKAAETQLEKARSVESAPPDAVNKAELAKEKAAAKVAETQGQAQAAKLQAEAKMAAAERAGEEAKAAEAARDVAVEQAEEATRKTSPVSVFISRKTQRLYIRQGYQPVFEAPITIRDVDKPIGSYVFTALSYVNSAEVRWSVVSMYKGPDAAAAPHPPAKHGRADSRGETAPADVAGAKAALDRIAIPRDALERISQVVLPGSSLIISDESASIETGKDTDFVVLMSGEPQGGIKTRRREPRFRNDDFFGGPPFGGFRMFWN